MAFPSDLPPSGEIPPVGWPDQFETNNRISFDFESTFEQAAWWEHAIYAKHGLFPGDFADKLRSSLPIDLDVKLLGIAPDEDSFSIALTWPGSGAPLLLFGSTYKMALSLVFHDSLFSEEPSRNAGYTKLFMRNTRALCNEIGFVTMQLKSTMVGRYAWARYGFTPTFSHWYHRIRPALSARASKLWEILTEDERVKISAALKSTDPQSIWLIADLSRKIKTSNRLERSNTAHDVDQKVAVGMVLLAGIDGNWSSAIDFRDKFAMERFENYLAGEENERL